MSRKEKRMVKRKIKFAQYISEIEPYNSELRIAAEVLEINLKPRVSIQNIQIEITFEIEEEEEVEE